MKSKKGIIIAIIVIIIIVAIIVGYFFLKQEKSDPEQVLNDYIAKINEEKYDEMYQMLDEDSKQKISQEDFITRNKNIYQGIDMSNMKIEIKNEDKSGKVSNITYQTKMNTVGGEVSFENTITLNKNSDKQYKIAWSSNLIFPDLNDTDKVRVTTNEATRGIMTDRNGLELATNGKASSIGIVPGKLGENQEESIQKLAALLNMTAEAVSSKLQASWVQEDSFVPIKTVSLDETELKENLLQIPGIKITTVNARTYPLGEAASHLTGYVQAITQEELEKNSDYSSSSIIGKTGLEKQYESRLKGKDGVEIYIVDEEGNKK